jgi:hypothetical protein
MSDIASLGASEPQRLDELLRIMDVATVLRRERERAAAELDADQARAHLRQRLLEAAQATGEQVTPAEVDVAIERYFDAQHEFREPKPGLATALAHLYVRRVPILVIGALVLGAAAVLWWLFAAASGPFSPSGATERRVAATMARMADHQRAVLSLGPDADAKAEMERLWQAASAQRERGAVAELDRTARAAAALRAELAEEFTVVVVNRPGARSGVQRRFDESGKTSGYYLIVEARSGDGKVIPRRIANAEENGAIEQVSEWGEQVPREVYDRVAADKRDDGIVDEALFAVKRSGRRGLEMRMRGADGKPIARGRQITRW